MDTQVDPTFIVAACVFSSYVGKEELYNGVSQGKRPVLHS